MTDLESINEHINEIRRAISKGDGTNSAHISGIHDVLREAGAADIALATDVANTEGMIVFWDEEAGNWLISTHVDGRRHRFPREEFPPGIELFVAWGDYNLLAVEDTPLYHNTWGLDEARESA